MKKINFKRFPFFQRSWWTVEFGYRIIAVIAFFALFILLFNLPDITPATQEDFQPLYEQQQIILDDPSMAREMDNLIVTYSSSEIKYVLSSKECDLVFVVSKDSDVLVSNTEIDNSKHILEVSVLTFSAALGGAALISMIYLGIANFIKFISKKICLLFQTT